MTVLGPSFPAERIAREIITAPEDVVFVSGSLVEGFGNDNSDLDLFLVRHEGERTPDPRLVLATVGVEGAYVDYEVYNQANMAAISVAINTTDVTNFRAVWETSLDRIDLYYRTAVADPVHNPEGLRLLQHDFDRGVAARLLQTWTGLHSVVRLQEARQSLDAGYAPQALVSAQAAAAYAADSYLASEGEAYPNLKWRYEKIERRFGGDSALFRKLWALKSPGTRGVPAYLHEVRAFCDEMGMGRYVAWDVDALLLSQAREVRLFPLGQRNLLVQNKTMLFELNAFAVSVWRTLRRPLTRTQLIQRTAKRWRLADVEAARDVDALLRSWKRYRLVRES
jgi:Coenzyme PQQ synthesis protein D (PqqD)